MNSLFKIICEEYYKIINEDYDDSAESFYDARDTVLRDIFDNFLYENNADFTKNTPWTVIPFPRLKKIWEDYMNMGIVRDTKGLEMIENIMTNNTLKVSLFTELAGHTPYSTEDTFDEYLGYFVDEQINCIQNNYQDLNQLELPFDNPQSGYKKKESNSIGECNTTVHPYIQEFVDNNDLTSLSHDELKKAIMDELEDKFLGYYIEDPRSGQAYISDYGMKPLETLLFELFRTNKPEAKLVTIDKMLNVVHVRSDIAAWFVEGGSSALRQLSGYYHDDNDSNSAISGKYKMSDY